MTILGIDPGSVRVGYGLVEKRAGVLVYRESGLLETPGGTKAERLVGLERSLTALVLRVKPDRAGIERLFITKNQKTVMEVAEARGVIVAALTRQGIPLIELSPPEIKLAVTGDGRATKEAVARMVSRTLLSLPREKRIDDVTDALGIAIAVSGNMPGRD